MNTLVLEALPYLKPLYPHLRFIHQTGEKDFERVKKAHADAGTNARVEKFIYEMAATYESASLLICRAGASTLAEIATVGRADDFSAPFPRPRIIIRKKTRMCLLRPARLFYYRRPPRGGRI